MKANSSVDINYTQLRHLGMLPQIFLAHRDSLNLEKDQIIQLRSLKLEHDTAVLKDISELKILELYIQDLVYQDSVNTESLDQKIHELADKFKNLISDVTYANVKAKAHLNETQLDTFDKLAFQHGKEHHRH
ncbi:MAG: hypothetical protein HF970_13300 [ANME-2 cluster archaeon]|nr:hypothetical protein [ANME-2 cluster archaeon]